MQGGRGRGRGDPFFGSFDPFAGFSGMPSLFGERDPFDDPFFTNPLGGMLQPSPFGHAGGPFMGASPFDSSLFGPNGSPFGSSLFGPNGSPFMDTRLPITHEHRQSMPNSSRGLIIEELNSDDEKDEPEAGHGRELNQTQSGNQHSLMHDTRPHPQAHSFTFQSSTVTYGGSNGAYYTSSTTRRADSDGLRFEEHKEADSTTGQAAHRISRGIHDKGHTLSRHLKSDGQVDTMQTLHNINEDELTGFEEAWKGKARKYLPGWTGAPNDGVEGSGGWALPSTENTHAGGRRRLGAAENGQSSKVRRH
ncbi:putative myeloid leukemia factor [Helianthus debilis subsp. tardiflorus]